MSDQTIAKNPRGHHPILDSTEAWGLWESLLAHGDGPAAETERAVARQIEHLLAIARSAALEEAATVAEEWGERKDQTNDEKTAFVPGADFSEQFASNGIAERIRALKDKPNE